MSSTPLDLEKYVKWHSRRIAALEARMELLDPGFVPAAKTFGRAAQAVAAPVDRLALLHRVVTSTEEGATEAGRPPVAAPVGELHPEEAAVPSAAAAGEAPSPTASPATDVVAGEQRVDTVSVPEPVEPLVPPVEISEPPKTVPPARVPVDTVRRPPTPSTDFMTEEEAAGLPPIKWSDEEPEHSRSIEEAIGAKWLLRAGGVLLIIGAVIGARMIVPSLSQEMKFALTMAFSLLVGGVGFFVERRHALAGRTTMVIAIAIAYFASFASHFIMKPPVFAGLMVPVTLMFALAGLKVWLADRWRSEFVTIFGVALGTLSALLAAPQSGTFTLLALGILAAVAGILLIKNEWFRLTGITLAGIYASLAIFWHIVPVAQDAEGFLINLGAVLIYHVMFTLAFWRWSRPWIAREQLADDPDELVTPRIDRMRIPYGSGFAILNSLGLIGLSLWLCYQTQIYWAHVEWLLAGLAYLEVARLLVPTLRPKIIAPFHLFTATVLGTMALIAAVDGDVRLTALAAETLILVIAASLSPSLKWLRILAILPAFLSIGATGTLFTTVGQRLFGGLPAPAPAQSFADIFAGLLLLASALPWPRILRRRHEVELGELGEALAVFTSHMRALAGTAIVISAILVVSNGWAGMMAPIVAFTILLVVGRVMIPARDWSTSTVGAVIVSVLLIVLASGTKSTTLPLIGVAITLLMVTLDVWMRACRGPFRTGVGILSLPASLGFVFAVGIHAEDVKPLSGLLMGGFAILSAVSLAIGQMIKLPVLLEESEPDLNPSTITASTLSAALFMVTAFAFSLVMDAQYGLTSPLVMSAISFAAWAIIRDRAGEALSNSWFAATFAMLVIAVLLNTEGSAIGLVAVTSIALATLGVGSLLGIRVAQLVGGATLPLLAAATVLRSESNPGIAAAASILVAIGGVILRNVATKAREDGLPDTNAEGISRIATIGTGVVGLLALRLIDFGVPYTVRAGGFAVVLLVAGFVMRHKLLRMVGMGAFLLAMGRVAFIDLAGSDEMTKLLAALGIGVLAIVSGLGYNLASKRLGDDEK